MAHLRAGHLPVRRERRLSGILASSGCVLRISPQACERTPVTNVVIASAARTAIGSYGKSLASVPPSDLGATAAKAAIERAGIGAEQRRSRHLRQCDPH